MTPEQKRERLLKRILPGMAITVIYFVFVSGLLSEKMQKAEETYQGLYRQGISPAALPGVMNQVDQTRQQIDTLQRQQSDLGRRMLEIAGFLSGESSINEATALLSEIMMRHNIWVIEEKRETFPVEQLSVSLREVLQWVEPEGGSDSSGAGNGKAKSARTIQVGRLSLRGAYLDMYRALAELAASGFKGVPVQLTMQTPEDGALRQGELEWELILWM